MTQRVRLNQLKPTRGTETSGSFMDEYKAMKEEITTVKTEVAKLGPLSEESGSIGEKVILIEGVVDGLTQTVSVIQTEDEYLKAELSSIKELIELIQKEVGEVVTIMAGTYVTKDELGLLSNSLNGLIESVTALNEVVEGFENRVNAMEGVQSTINEKLESIQTTMQGVQDTISDHALRISKLEEPDEEPETPAPVE